ncbi:MAG TPA: FimV/HubP family polar landmark protein [Pseudomonas sp.]|uniref:FimV/HubP family polar landmark protein n=1 Tax=Pseudomonas sp. TaxID=306 RepID=UPI002B46DA31|nr:FimV/HubP family polar landmark protein [Pseudomonas sp.]HKS12230.1 FimV/HubP family polar landmark protein [Pseudomonas sp.]
MLRIRKLVLAIAAASALSSGTANALGLGELTLRSAQNQPLDAEIELLDVRDLTSGEVEPGLASPEEFAKAGVAYAPYLEDLTFTPVIIPNGKSMVRVTSSQPLPAPVVKFLVQVMWPQGRLLRDYSMLLDQAQAQGSQAQAGVAPAVSYTTRSRDTLWQIAARVTQGGSVQQTMIAIQALNPDAFINNNINLLKAGQVLRLPDPQQVKSIPQGEAVQEVAEQYAAWREGRRLGPRARQLDATRRASAEDAPSRIAQPDNLRLVAPSSEAATDENKALSDQLAVAEESLDTSRRDNEELKSRNADLQSQLDKLQRLIALKNDQLARLEAQSGTAQPPAALPGETPATLPGEAPAGQPAVGAPLTPGETVVEPAPAAADTAPTADAAPSPDAAATPGEDEPEASGSVLDNPMWLVLIAGSAFLALLLLLLLLARKRKADQEAEKHLRMARALAEEGEREPDLDLSSASFDGLDHPAPTVKLSPGMVAASAAAATAAEHPSEPAPAPAPVGEPASAPVVANVLATPAAIDKVLEEAERSIAQGRLNHAAELLEPAVAAQPDRSELRLKLMEVYARQGDRDGFVGQERQLVATGQNHADAEALKQRFPAMLGVAAAGVGAAALAAELDAQYVQELLSDQAPAAQGDAADDTAFDLSVDDDLLLDEPPQSPAKAQPTPFAAAEPAVPSEPAGGDADADFEALLAQAQADSGNSPDDLADFDLDLSEPEPVAPAAPAAQAPVDVAAELAAFDTIPEFDPISELDLPEDFDLSLSLDDESPADKRFASELEDVNAELDKLPPGLDTPPDEPRFTAEDAALEPVDDLDFDFFSGTDEVATKLDLARAYIDMGDHDGARDILDEVVKDGDDTQRQEAQDMLSRLV